MSNSDETRVVLANLIERYISTDLSWDEVARGIKGHERALVEEALFRGYIAGLERKLWKEVLASEALREKGLTDEQE